MDIIHQIVAQEQSVFIMLAEFAVFTVLISLIIYHLIIYVGRKSFPEGKLYLYFSSLFLGLLLYIFLDTCQFGILFWNIINVPAWSTFLISVSWLIILKSIMLILQYSLKPTDKNTTLLKKVFIGFASISFLCLMPVFFPLERYHYFIFLGLWVGLGTTIVFLSNVYFPILRRGLNIDKSSKIIGWTALLYINYIWFYKLTITSIIGLSRLPFWVMNNFLKIAVAFTFAYALARRFNKEFTDLVELKENLEKKVEENTRELRRAKEKIEEASAQKTNYFINVAHETKTPLTLIGNYLDRYSKRVGPSDELTIVKENFKLLRESMILFLDVQKFEQGEVIYNNSSIINLSKALSLKTPLLKAEALHQNRHLTIDLAEDVCIQCDPLAIERIIHNLFDNALKFTRQDDEIRIALTKNGNMAQLMVSDTGIGINSTSLHHVFDLYFQASTEKSDRIGFGMGLYIVKKTVEAIGGKIQVKSQIEKGTTFIIHLPLSDPGLISVEPQTEPFTTTVKNIHTNTSLGYEPERNTLLVIEDNVHMRQYLHEELTLLYNVFTASNGNEAVALLRTSPLPDLILSDVMMNGMDGFEFYNLISKEEKYACIPFIFITARSNNDEKIALLSQGVYDYMFKPFSIDELKAKIRSVLKNKTLYRNAGLQDAIQAISNLGAYQTSQPNKWEKFLVRAREFDLTERQIEVIKLVEQGLEYKQIAEELNISPKTIHRHIQILFEKFQVHNKLELVKILFN